jgi:hypothetical protein
MQNVCLFAKSTDQLIALSFPSKIAASTLLFLGSFKVTYMPALIKVA